MVVIVLTNRDIHRVPRKNFPGSSSELCGMLWSCLEWVDASHLVSVSRGIAADEACRKKCLLD